MASIEYSKLINDGIVSSFSFPLSRFNPDMNVCAKGGVNHIVQLVAGPAEFGAVDAFHGMYMWWSQSDGATKGNGKFRFRRVLPSPKMDFDVESMAIGLDGQLIVADRRGFVYLCRKTKKRHFDSQMIEDRVYECVRVPSLHKTVTVAASPAGSWGAICSTSRKRFIAPVERDITVAFQETFTPEEDLSPFTSKKSLEEEDVLIRDTRGPHLLEVDSMSDVEFVVEGRRFYCHRIVLASRWKFFRELFMAKDNELELFTTVRRKGRTVMSEAYFSHCTTLAPR